MKPDVNSPAAPSPEYDDPDSKNYQLWLQSICRREASACGLDWMWVYAVLGVETDFGRSTWYLDHGRASQDGLSWGIAQFRPSTAADFAGRAVTPDDLRSDEFSVMLCARYLRKLSDIFPYDEKSIIMSYNQGQGNTLRGRDNTPYYTKWQKKLSSFPV